MQCDSAILQYTRTYILTEVLDPEVSRKYQKDRENVPELQKTTIFTRHAIDGCVARSKNGRRKTDVLSLLDRLFWPSDRRIWPEKNYQTLRRSFHLPYDKRSPHRGGGVAVHARLHQRTEEVY